MTTSSQSDRFPSLLLGGLLLTLSHTLACSFDSQGATATPPGAAGFPSIDAASDTPDVTPIDAPPDVAFDLGPDVLLCFPPLKKCDTPEGEACVSPDLPQYGCTTDTCSSCPSVAHGNATCSEGKCTVGSCELGWANCKPEADDGCETHIASDSQNCGIDAPSACGHTCQLGNTATTRCEEGICRITQCESGFDDCNGDDSDGCETSLATLDNCGGCRVKCTSPSGNVSCATGECRISNCPAGFEDCDGRSNNGCETNLNLPTSCGSCSNDCTQRDLGVKTWACTQSQCTVKDCKKDLGNCDSNHANGCETDLLGAPLHCGTCNTACSTSGVQSTSCTNGLCTPICSPDRGNCNGPRPAVTDDGCEVSINSDVAHCGSCGQRCETSNVSVRSCQDGICRPTCVAGRGDCNPAPGATDDGCESNLNADVNNCGSCARSCASTNTLTRACSFGVCTSNCTAGWGNCSFPAAPSADNGCESNLNTDTGHCGSCGRACSGSNTAARTCATGLCISSCLPGWGNCVRPSAPIADDGCESNLSSNVSNCGACGRICSPMGVHTRACTSGQCTSSCLAGSGNCSRPSAPQADDGCETNIYNDELHCGGCERPCSTSNVAIQNCSGGVCDSSCQAGRGNCVRPAFPAVDDGCEQDTTSDVNHCGSCSPCPTPDPTLHVESGCASSTCSTECLLDWSDCDANLANGCECPGSFTCTANSCKCDADDDCGNGGICNTASGVCTCGASVCGPTERCTTANTCG